MSFSKRKSLFGKELPDLSPEEKFLWWMLHVSAETLKAGFTSQQKSAIIEAIECYDWFFKRTPYSKGQELRMSDFRSVCKALDIDFRRILKAIESNPDFPSRACLVQKLGTICDVKQKRRRKKKCPL